MKPRIVALCGPLKGLVFFIESQLNIGRGKNNHVRLDDPRVALRHTGIIFEYERCLIFAQESERGTFVNEFGHGAKILVHGDGPAIFTSRSSG